MSSISLTASMRSNLSSLRSIGAQMDKTQERLSSGLKVNSAIDNASSYYQSRSLTNRAADLDSLLDAMGQGIQTIQAATQGIEAGITYLEQASAVITQAIVDSGQAKTTADWVAAGYTKIDSTMDAAAIEALLAEGKTKLVLDSDIEWTGTGLNITQKDVFIEGNGHRITFTGDNDAAIHIDGGQADIKNLYVHAEGENAYALYLTNKVNEEGKISSAASLNIDNVSGITANGAGARRVVNGDLSYHNGKANTETLKNQNGINLENYPAFKAAIEYSVSNDDGEVIDAGNWYLPAIGELMHFYDNKDVINEALSTVGGDVMGDTGWYWSSNEVDGDAALELSLGHKTPRRATKRSKDLIRAYQIFENCYNPLSDSFGDSNKNMTAPKIGQIMYRDTKADNKLVWADAMKSEDTPDGYVAIGVITNVSATGDITIAALKNANNGASVAWGPYQAGDDTDIPNVVFDNKFALANVNTDGIVTNNNQPFTTMKEFLGEKDEQLQLILSEYDKLINDASYQGINLLKGNKLDVTFNETRSNKFTIQGKDISFAELGIKSFEWLSQEDAAQALEEVDEAIERLRSYSSELGNSYSIIQTRENFTDAMINVLETGSDMLVLADMNEESANYLALQTRQQLAVNSLSLAAQSAQSVLSLF